MKLSTKSPGKNSIGCFIVFCDSPDEKVHVEITENTRYYMNVNIMFPMKMNGSKLPFLRTAINRVGRGSSFPVRINYDNLTMYFTLEEMSLLESVMQFASFYIYKVPKEVLPELTSSLDIQSIQNKIRRLNDREKRQQHILAHTSPNIQGG